MTSHLVFGAGLIGSYLAAALSRSADQVALVCRPSQVAERKQGMALSDYNGNRVEVRDVLCVDQTAAKSDFSVLWLTVKCHSVEAAIEDMHPWVAEHTLILCCQNGLGSEKAVKKAFPNNRVMRVMVPFNVVEQTSGHFHRGSEGKITLEACAQTRQLAQAIDQPLLPADVCEHMDALLWAKLQLNLSNGVNGLADMPVRAMLEQRAYRRIIADLMRELLAVTHDLDITLPKLTSVKAGWLPAILDLPDWLFTRLANKMLAIDPQVRTSMWWDLTNGKPTEVDYLNGALVDTGGKIGLECPMNRHLVALIHQVECGERQMGLSAAELSRLLKNA